MYNFHGDLNKLHPDIQFTMEYSSTSLPFLDVLIKKSGTIVSTDIFYKPTDSKQYLNFKSCHPKHTKTNIPYNLARRICTIVSDEQIRDKKLRELQITLDERDYPKLLVQDSIHRAKQINRSELLTVRPKSDLKIIPYISTFNPNNLELFHMIKNNLPILQTDSEMSKILSKSKIIRSKRQAPNLKQLLTKARFSYKVNMVNKVTKCNRSNCSLCQHIVESEYYNFKGNKFYVNQNMSCDVQNVLYVLTCTGCNEYYIGQTGDKLRTRRTIHSQQIRDPSTRQIPLSEHLDKCGNQHLKYEMFPFYKLKTNIISARLSKEKYFITKFKPLLNAKTFC